MLEEQLDVLEAAGDWEGMQTFLEELENFETAKDLLLTISESSSCADIPDEPAIKSYTSPINIQKSPVLDVNTLNHMNTPIVCEDHAPAYTQQGMAAAIDKHFFSPNQKEPNVINVHPSIDPHDHLSIDPHDHLSNDQRNQSGKIFSQIYKNQISTLIIPTINTIGSCTLPGSPFKLYKTDPLVGYEDYSSTLQTVGNHFNLAMVTIHNVKLLASLMIKCRAPDETQIKAIVGGWNGDFYNNYPLVITVQVEDTHGLIGVSINPPNLFELVPYVCAY